MILQPKSNPVCSTVDPELWFPDPKETCNESVEKHKLFINKAVKAIKLCHTCPLFEDNSCLEYAMQDPSTIDYGIWAGTLPMERRSAVGLGIDKGNLWQIKIRNSANKEGIIPTSIPKRKRLRSSHLDYLDTRAIRLLQKELDGQF